MAQHSPQKIQLANLPTRIHCLPVLSRELNAKLWVKRDDETSSALSGNKVRKLEYLIPDALKKGADTLITCGAVQSNHCRATAIAGRLTGLNSRLVLRGEPGRLEGNYFLDKMVGAEFRFITEEEWEFVEDIMEEESRKLAEDGRKAYIIPEGGSNGIGIWGYINAAEEIKRQENELGLKFDRIVASVGSGATLAGLLVGKRRFNWDVRITGVNAWKESGFFPPRILEIIEDYKNVNDDHSIEVAESEIGIIGGYVGEGYGLSTEEELQFIVDVARKEGILVDPVYTGKALRGLIDSLESGEIPREENILFIHTGGLFGLFPKWEMFEKVI
ncbi:MAG: D-cysteine desulfhydrase family protein [Acidobacteria bacterium]|nr:D-cysteine desulfhydrase family protein [Acidobacteriota bacterium]